MNSSKVEQLILDKNFAYLQPYFYNNPYSLRCELGIGTKKYMKNAKKRAIDIYNILFPCGADAIFFNYWIYDYCDCGNAEKEIYESDQVIKDIINHRISGVAENLRFLSVYQMNYRHYVLKNLETYHDDDENVRRNRVICYRDNQEFDYNRLIDSELNSNGHEVSFVSFENECIFSIYDDRGCDIVFATKEKMKEFYDKLKPYFLPYDVEEMKRRFNE